jgi:glycosyltransferase involved in cell wall biosynthesis
MARDLRISVIVCAHNEARYLPACLHSVLAQSRQPDELLVINNASTDDTAAVAAQIPFVQVIDEPRKRLVVARETGRRHALGDILIYLDADCRAPLTWIARIERRFQQDADLIALSGPYRYYDWDWWGRSLIRAYDFTGRAGNAAPHQATFSVSARFFYGGNFAVRREALERIGGFDTSIEFHGEDTNVGRRLSAIGKVGLFHDCYLHTSARRYIAMGKREVFRLYVRNFISELLHHRPKDTAHMDIRS